MEKQLHSALQELKLAEAIISLLQEDMKNTSHVTTADLQTPAVTCEASGYNQTSENWTSVIYNNNEKNLCLKYREYGTSCISLNHFAPLSNLIEKQEEEMEYTHNCDLPVYSISNENHFST
jgi:hypothetical protein